MDSPPPRPQPADCLAAVFDGAGQPLQLRRFEVPIPSAGEAVVKIDCCTLCGSDLHTVTGARQEATPSILGHEILGTVCAIGQPPLKDVDGQPLQLGDRVTWSVCVSCGNCDRCRRGLPQKCREVAKYGHERACGPDALSGGLANTLLLRRGSSVVTVPSEIPDLAICPVNCATATVMAAYRAAGNIKDRRVLIFGAGMLGLTAASVARSEHAVQVVVCDPNTERLRFAQSFGADGLVEGACDDDSLRQRLTDASESGSYDLVLEMSGAPKAVEIACDVADMGSVVVLVGSVMASRNVQIDPQSIVRRCLSIRGVHNYAPEDLKAAVAFVSQNHQRFPFESVVTATFPLAEVNEAIETAIRERPVRIAIRP